LLITFLLCAEGALAEPLLYLSLYFKTHRSTYYDLLQGVREDGAWEDWLRFFLAGVQETADQAAQAARRILHLFEQDRRRIAQLGRAASSALRVHQLLQRKPILSIPKAATALNLSAPTVTSAVQHLQEMEITREMTGGRRNRLYLYEHYLAILNEGTEPL